jgi:hypothetical protein
LSLHGRVDDSAGGADAPSFRAGVAEFAGQALDGRGYYLEAIKVAALPEPAAQSVAGAGEVAHEVAPHQARRPRDRDLHNGLLGRQSTTHLGRSFDPGVIVLSGRRRQEGEMARCGDLVRFN